MTAVKRQTTPESIHANEASDDDDIDPRWGLCFPASMLLFVLGIAVAGTAIGWDKVFAFVFDAVEDHDAKLTQGIIINTLLIFVTVACLPAPLFYLILNGFIFGFWYGWLINYCAMTTAALLTRALAQTCLKDRVRKQVMKSPSSREVLDVLEEDPSGKFLLLFRFILIPGFIKNYTMGMLEISWLKFLLTITPGELFYTGIFAYIGSKAYKVADKLRKGDTTSVTSSLFSGLEIVLIAVSALVFLLLAYFSYKEYHRRREHLDEHSERQPLAAKRQPAAKGQPKEDADA